MNIRHLPVLIFLICSTFSFSQSENETLSFLNTKLASYSSPLGYSPVVWRFSSIKDQPKHLMVDMIVSNKPFAKYIIDSEALEEVAPNRAPNGNLCLKLVSPLGLIMKRYTDEEMELTDNIQLALETSDEEVHRIRRAIIHLLELKGAKFPSDDLFRN